jgi:hypothetical protein
MKDEYILAGLAQNPACLLFIVLIVKRTKN